MGFILMKRPLLYIPKTREMMTSWLVTGFTWFSQFYPTTEACSQSESDSKAQGLISYSNILFVNQEPWMRDRYPLLRGDAGTLHDIAWARIRFPTQYGNCRICR